MTQKIDIKLKQWKCAQLTKLNKLNKSEFKHICMYMYMI